MRDVFFGYFTRIFYIIFRVFRGNIQKTIYVTFWVRMGVECWVLWRGCLWIEKISFWRFNSIFLKNFCKKEKKKMRGKVFFQNHRVKNEKKWDGIRTTLRTSEGSKPERFWGLNHSERKIQSEIPNFPANAQVIFFMKKMFNFSKFQPKKIFDSEKNMR